MITNEELAVAIAELREQVRELQSFVQGRMDSIEVNKTSTGKYSWSVKVYCADHHGGIEKVKDTEAKLAKLYGVV